MHGFFQKIIPEYINAIQAIYNSFAGKINIKKNLLFNRIEV